MKKYLIVIGVLLLVFLGGWYFFLRDTEDAESSFELTEIKKGNIENIVSSTGTLIAVGTVEVGTQVSGIVDQVYVDFNDVVKKGQILAVLDTTNLAIAIRDAKAGMIRVQAQYDQAKSDFERSQKLYEKNLISELEFTAAKTQLQSTLASLKSSQVSLERAKNNLKYAVIRSPINGKVINRNVEPGQTVAASFSTPTLFLIANDLQKMEIKTQVDESDIGLIEVGQEVRFSVQAYSEEKFFGVLKQIRLQPQTVQNVVNYNVIVDADNEDELLLPGMTATVDFIIEHREDVLLVPNAALRFQPTQMMMDEFRENIQKQFDSLPDSIKNQRRQQFGNMSQSGREASERMGQLNGMKMGGSSQRNSGRLWYIDENRKLNITRVRTGATDGKVTEISGRNIEEGKKVITGLSKKEQQTQQSNRIPSSTFRRSPF
jgi:HlyD family secretion protein